jgi:hypothetical protein
MPDGTKAPKTKLDATILVGMPELGGLEGAHKLPERFLPQGTNFAASGQPITKRTNLRIQMCLDFLAKLKGAEC